MHKLLVGGVPGAGGVEVGLQHAVLGAARQAVGLGDQFLGLADGFAQGGEPRVCQAHIHRGHDPGGVARHGIDGLVAGLEAIGPPVRFPDAPQALARFERVRGVAKDPLGVPGRVGWGWWLGGIGIHFGDIEEEGAGVVEKRAEEAPVGPGGGVEGDVVLEELAPEEGFEVIGRRALGREAERDAEARLGGNAGPIGAGKRRGRGALAAAGPGGLDPCDHGIERIRLLLVQGEGGAVLARDGDGQIGLPLLDAPGRGEFRLDRRGRLRCASGVADPAGIERGGPGLRYAPLGHVAVQEGPEPVQDVAPPVERVRRVGVVPVVGGPVPQRPPDIGPVKLHLAGGVAPARRGRGMGKGLDPGAPEAVYRPLEGAVVGRVGQGDQALRLIRGEAVRAETEAVGGEVGAQARPVPLHHDRGVGREVLGQMGKHPAGPPRAGQYGHKLCPHGPAVEGGPSRRAVPGGIAPGGLLFKMQGVLRLIGRAQSLHPAIGHVLRGHAAQEARVRLEGQARHAEVGHASRHRIHGQPQGGHAQLIPRDG